MNSAISELELRLLYESNGLFARIIDTPAEDSTLPPVQISCQDRRAARHLEETLDRLDISEKLCKALAMARLFGGSVAVLLVADGKGLEDPVSPAGGAVEHIQVYDSTAAMPVFADDPQRPEYFRIDGQGGCFTVHQSRCLVFRNAPLPERHAAKDNYWGIPEYLRIEDALQQAEGATYSAVRILERAPQAVYKIHGLSNMLQTEAGENTVRKMLELLDTSQGLLNSVAIDSLDEYRFLSAESSGVREAIQASRNFLCAVSGIPKVILFGREPSKKGRSLGKREKADESSTDKDSDTRRFYNHANMEHWQSKIEELQRCMIHPALVKLSRIIEPEAKPQITFGSLHSETAIERADGELRRTKTALIKAKTGAELVNTGVLSAEELRPQAEKFLDVLF